MDIAMVVLIAFGGFLFGLVFLGIFLNKKKTSLIFKEAAAKAQKVRSDAQEEAKTLIKQTQREVKFEAKRRRRKFEDDAKEKREELLKVEKKIKQREDMIEKKLSIIDKRDEEIETLQNRLKKENDYFHKKNAEVEIALEKNQALLQNIAKMSPEQAKRELVKSLESVAKKEAAEKIKEIEQNIHKEAAAKATAIISLAVQRAASDYVNDTTVSVVSLPDDHMKGRIIGREGRNIRAFEQATGVDLIIDDTPEAVIVSCFNPIRREMAKQVIGRLISDGRIHPARITETVKRVKEDFDQSILEWGEQAAYEVGITDLSPELIKHLGKLKFSLNGDQTVLQHSVEVAHLCGVIASELSLKIKLAKRIGLLHDIGKAVDQDVEGHHASIGSKLVLKYDESEEISNAIARHHDIDLTFASPYAIVVHAANIMSARRPGARKENMQSYINRLEDMEELVCNNESIKDAFVMQTGNEVRAIVNPINISDEMVNDLAGDIAFKIREEITFPGQVQVTIIREDASVSFAT